mgnify:CR=1 FL=1
MIPYGRQDISKEDINEVLEVLQSDYLTQGPKVPLFERKVAEHVGAKYSVAVNSATSALHIACLSLGLEEGEWLWTTPVSFVASANCGLYCGAKVDFVDIDPATYNLCPKALGLKLEQAKLEGCLPKVVVVVHLCGQPCDMLSIYNLSKLYGFRIIEDASHAIGGKYCGDYIGGCKYSDVTIFSFHPVKIITTAEGGMALTNNAELASRMELYRSHGITRDSAKMTKASDGPWYYQQIALGFNYRMTDLQGALGLSQLKRLDKLVSRRHELAKRYDKLLEEQPVQLPWQHPDSYSGLHLYVVRLRLGEISKTYRQVFEAMRNGGVNVNLHYIPIHTQPFYRQFGYSEGDYPEAEKYYREAISLPMYPSLTEREQDFVVSMLRSSLS